MMADAAEKLDDGDLEKDLNLDPENLDKDKATDKDLDKDKPELKAGEDDKTKDGDGKTGPSIPKHRYDFAKKRAQDAEEENARLKRELEEKAAQTQVQQEPDLDAELVALDKKIAQAASDGEYEKQAELASQARQIERKISQQLIQEQLSQSSDATVQRVELQTAIDEATRTYPVFDTESDDYDENLVKEVLDLHEGLVAKGHPPGPAMTRAVAYVVPGAPPVLDPAKRATKIDKNLDAAKRQPAGLDKAGVDSDKTGKGEIDPLKMTDEEFDALPAETKSRMRGDFL